LAKSPFFQANSALFWLFTPNLQKSKALLKLHCVEGQGACIDIYGTLHFGDPFRAFANKAMTVAD
jgi:hypothetical protein